MTKVISVRILIGSHAYAVIEHTTGKLDLLLSAGKSPEKSLRETAKSHREDAVRHLRLAHLAEEAARVLEAGRQ